MRDKSFKFELFISGITLRMYRMKALVLNYFDRKMKLLHLRLIIVIIFSLPLHVSKKNYFTFLII